MDTTTKRVMIRRTLTIITDETAVIEVPKDWALDVDTFDLDGADVISFERGAKFESVEDADNWEEVK